MRAYEVAAAAGVLMIVTAAPSLRASELVWSGETGCQQPGQLSFELERALGQPLSAAGELSFHVTTERTSDAVSARLRVDDGAVAGAPDERILAAATCAELIDTLAVAITLAIGSAESSDAAREPVAASPSIVEREPIVETDAGQDFSAAPGMGARPGAVALLVADVGSLPHAALGAGLGLELSWARLRLQLGALMFYPQRAEWGGGL